MTPQAPRRHPALRVSFAADGALLAENPTQGVPLSVSRPTLDLLALCDGARSPDEIARALDWPGSLALRRVAVREALTSLAERGLLAGPTAPGHGYAHPGIHRVMIGDQARTTAFQRALAATVRPGQVVVDVGTGSGILAVFAARAGAARVHAIDRAEILDSARAVLERNGLADRVSLHRADAHTWTPPEPADVIVSEWLGAFALAEGMFPAVAAVRDACLRPGGRMIPSRVDLLLAPCVAPPRLDLGFWSQAPFGVDLTPLEAIELDQLWSAPAEVTPDQLLAEPATVHSIDCLTAGRADLAFRAEVSFELERDGVIGGLCGHFVAHLAPDVVLDTGPHAPPTHWHQHLLPIQPLSARAGDRLQARFTARESPGDPRQPVYELELSLGDQRRHHVYNHRG
jgi:Arginine methyltransferase oligomerization subdomain/Ribosomal protein L11 methyltransferase (PrmA)